MVSQGFNSMYLKESPRKIFISVKNEQQCYYKQKWDKRFYKNLKIWLKFWENLLNNFFYYRFNIDGSRKLLVVHPEL